MTPVGVVSVAVVIRMPAELHKAVKDKAATEERSMAQAIRFALRQYVTPVGVVSAATRTENAQ